MADFESLTPDDYVRLARELFDPERCVDGFVAAVADKDPHLLPAARDLARFDEAPEVRLMRLYDLVEADPSSSFNRSKQIGEPAPPVTSTELREPSPLSRMIGAAVIVGTSVRIVEYMGAGIDPVQAAPLPILALGFGVLIYHAREILGLDN